MLNKIISVIIAVIGIIIYSLHNESYAMDRLDQDTPLTAPAQQTCSTNSGKQVCLEDERNCMKGGSASPVVEPADMAAITEDNKQIARTAASADPQNIISSSPVPIALSSIPILQNVTSLNADVIFSMINQYRTSIGLPAFLKDSQVCALAASRAPELYNEIMVTHTMHRGFYARNLPYQATENIIYMNSEQAAVTWWLTDPIHHAAIISNNTYSCVACSGKSCSEVFTSYQPK